MKTLAADLFEGLKPEEKQPEQKEFKVERTPTLDALVKGFDKLFEPNFNFDNYGFYQECEKQTPHNYSARDIELFSLTLGKYEDTQDFRRQAGLYISVLINKSSEEKFLVHTSHLPSGLDFLGGINQGKHITVKGDVGIRTAERMESGEIHIEGNEGGSGGSGMCGGKLYVHGNSGGMMAHEMFGGEIHIEGNVESTIGIDMTGGKVYIEGNYHSWARNMRRGEIYHKGKLIVYNGMHIKPRLPVKLQKMWINIRKKMTPEW